MLSEKEKEEIIKEFLELREIHSKNSPLTKSYLELYQEAIQGLLDSYEKEKEDVIKQYELGLTQGAYEKNLVWKDKIKAKIEEINNEKLNYSEDEWYLENEIKGYAIDKIKELLEESK